MSFGTANPPPQVTSESGRGVAISPRRRAPGTTVLLARGGAERAGTTTRPRVVVHDRSGAGDSDSHQRRRAARRRVATTATLTWSATGATSYDVSFGTANPPPQVTTSQAAASYQPATTDGRHDLSSGAWWRATPPGRRTGPVWSFTTASGADRRRRASPTPTNGATGVATTRDADVERDGGDVV